MSRFYERDDDLENELNKNALWSITYGDLMSYLMIFFLLMFAFSYTKSMKQQMGLMSIQAAAGGKQSIDVQQLFSKYGLQQIARVELTEEKLKITFLEPVLFDSGSADLKIESFPALHSIAKVLREIHNPVIIEGHTDNIPVRGRFKTNWELSTARAHSVLMFLLDEEKLPPERFSAMGHGEYQPVVPNDTPENRSINRRIEINVLRLE
jgi:chemotaxis protein MotB